LGINPGAIPTACVRWRCGSRRRSENRHGGTEFLLELFTFGGDALNALQLLFPVMLPPPQAAA